MYPHKFTFISSSDLEIKSYSFSNPSVKMRKKTKKTEKKIPMLQNELQIGAALETLSRGKMISKP